MSNASAIVFAYHNVGARCLSVLLAQGVDVRLVVTHADDPAETIWFDRVADIAALNGIPAVTPDPAELPALVERLHGLAPDFLFSFYYRHMLPEAVLSVPARGALNMHGSLLPKYRGRAPVNWAVLHGEAETGASLHYMTVKPDAGALVARQAVPILPNDTARDVFEKVTCAAELALAGALPGLIDGTAPAVPLDLASGSYFGRRRPADGRIDWTRNAWDVHNLIRAVAPPYPGAFTTLAGRPLRLLRSWFRNEPVQHRDKLPCFYAETGALYVDCRDGRRFRVLAAELDGAPLTAAGFKSRYGAEPVSLGE